MKQANDKYTTDLLDENEERLKAYQIAMQSIEHGIKRGIANLKKLNTEKAEIEELGYTSGTIHYKAGRYAYLIQPQLDGERVREYIGADPEKIAAAEQRIIRAVRRKQIEHDIQRIEHGFTWLDRYLLNDTKRQANEF